MFTTAKDIEAAGEETAPVPSTPDEQVATSEEGPTTDAVAINAKRAQIINLMSSRLKTSLVKKTRATYWDASHEIRIVCSISKSYPDPIYRYWYAYHPTWDAFLAEGKQAYVVWGCLNLDKAFAMPREKLHALLPQMITTTRPDGKIYWHIKILEKGPQQYFLQLPHGVEDLPLAPFEVVEAQSLVSD
jgi:hypothetical protein